MGRVVKQGISHYSLGLNGEYELNRDLVIKGFVT